MKILIRNFGNNTCCNSLKDLEISLLKYKGKSVSLQYDSPNGVKKIMFIDVGSTGSIKDSHTNKPLLLKNLFEDDN